MESLLKIGLPIQFALVLVQMYSFTRVVVRDGRQVSRVVRGYRCVTQGCTLSSKLFHLVYEFCSGVSEKERGADGEFRYCTHLNYVVHR